MISLYKLTRCGISSQKTKTANQYVTRDAQTLLSALSKMSIKKATAEIQTELDKLHEFYQKANKTSISSSKKIYDAIKQNLTENPNIEYVFEIPQHSQTANFIKFTKDFSEGILGKNIFSFKILEN